MTLPMTSPGAAVAASSGKGRRPSPSIPSYLEQTYWWAYVHPRAVQVFERGWLVNSILFGHYAQLREAALDALGAPQVTGRTLQLACVYGNLTARLRERMTPEARLDVVDILPIQLDNLRAKLPADARIALKQGDSSSLDAADGSYDQALLFFLLHEQPEAVRRATLAEAMRVVRPGGRIVIVDYAKPHAWHPLRPLMRQVFRFLEPYAMDLWRHDALDFLPPGTPPAEVRRTSYFGGLYQMQVLTR